MDGNRFDAWTRRRVGLAAGGVLAAFLALSERDEAAARRRRRRKRRKPRCLALGRTCNADDERCCGSLACDWVDLVSVDPVCCRPDGAACTPETTCCSSNCDAQSRTCTTCRGRPCDEQRPCCPLHECDRGFCGGCVSRGAACSATVPCCPGQGDCTEGLCGGCHRSETGIPTCTDGLPCCDTECTGNLCLSPQGGGCAFDKDCRACDENQDLCVSACVGGTCTV